MQYRLKPEVPAELADNTILDTSVHPPIVEELHLMFQDWLGDDLVECFPCYMVTKRLKELLEESDLNGFDFFNCQVTISQELALRKPDMQLPTFYWLKIGRETSVDFFLNKSLYLQVSEKAWKILNKVNLNYCNVSTVED